MPLYEYQCDACGHRFEAIQKLADAPIAACPSCGGVVKKLQYAPAFHFKGTGWYVTDYGRKDQPAAEKADGTSKEASREKSKESADTGSRTAEQAKSTTPSQPSSSGSASTPPSTAKD